MPMVMVPPPPSDDEAPGDPPVVVSLLLLEHAAPIRTTATSTTTDRHSVDLMPSLLGVGRALRTRAQWVLRSGDRLGLRRFGLHVRAQAWPKVQRTIASGGAGQGEARGRAIY